MESKDLAKLCENLSIKDEDSEIHHISEEVERDGVKDVDHCLVGKVLSGKRVNIEAFKSVIEQLWSPFGNVDIEMVGENIFMFYFKNPEDRRNIWRRGPWHFDRSLIVLKKPEGTGDISTLYFNKAEFWVQIHDIPIMCMNRRMVKWLAEQIGERWLRLKLNNSESIVMVGLKYKRLPEFCYACGRIGHGISECSDEEAKKEAIKGPVTRFGSWMRAASKEKVKSKTSSQDSGGSLVNERSLGDSGKREGMEIPKMVTTSLAAQKGRSESTETAMSTKPVEKIPETPILVDQADSDKPDKMVVDGPVIGPSELKRIEAQVSRVAPVEKTKTSSELLDYGPDQPNREDNPSSPIKQAESTAREQESKELVNHNLIVKGRKWKRVAREAQRKTKAGLLASPLQRKLLVSIPAMKTMRRNSPSLSKMKISPNTNNGMSILKVASSSQVALLNQGPLRAMIVISWNVRGVGNPRTFTALKRLVKKYSPDLVFLSETKIGSNRANKIEEFWGFDDGFGHIDARIQEENGWIWRFSGIYGEPNPMNRMNSWTLMRHLKEVDNLPWVCSGDFNELFSMKEKLGGSEKAIRDIIQFRQAVEDCDLIYLSFSGPMYTWNNKREGRENIQERLDRAISLGSAIRDDKSKVLVARARRIFGMFNKETGVLLALRDGLLMANFFGLHVKFAEIDFPPVMSILNSNAPYLGDAYFVVKDIKALLSDFGISSCQASSLLGNSLARNLAKLALSSCRDQFWNMDTKRLVIYHGGRWVGNSYEGGLTKWIYIPRGLTYYALVKLVQDVTKVDAARYTIELCSLVSRRILGTP
ncbi:hypothetical protein EZV62_008480 [Acer yangbiense]|uniref:CCHC-type domain-containing protein n=1 Tax=Acer yangbiense TaxID=1000413 RepID=A0A5C7IDS9_9ROSI|nr:hypothetical protein EZV62_008480 [Acer yangbiense]